MKYIMKLNPKYFEYMKCGTKRIEMRLNDEKRQGLEIGDEIVFQKEPLMKEEILTKITELVFKDSFSELAESFDISLYSDKSESKENFLKDLYKFYTKEKEKKYGVVGIRIEIKGE